MQTEIIEGEADPSGEDQRVLSTECPSPQQGPSPQITTDHPVATEPPPPTATDRRTALIAGVKDFDSKYPPKTTETAEEVIDRTFPQGKLPKQCEQCGQPFGSRKHGGGSPQRFCSRKCRMKWHAGQRNPACTLGAASTVPSPQGGKQNAPKNKLEDTDWKYIEGGVISKGLEVAIYQNASGEFHAQYVVSHSLVSELAGARLPGTNED